MLQKSRQQWKPAVQFCSICIVYLLDAWSMQLWRQQCGHSVTHQLVAWLANRHLETPLYRRRHLSGLSVLQQQNQWRRCVIANTSQFYNRQRIEQVAFRWRNGQWTAIHHLFVRNLDEMEFSNGNPTSARQYIIHMSRISAGEKSGTRHRESNRITLITDMQVDSIKRLSKYGRYDEPQGLFDMDCWWGC